MRLLQVAAAAGSRCGISSMSCSSAHHADCICVGYRALFIWLYRRCPRILDAVTIVRPETVQFASLADAARPTSALNIGITPEPREGEAKARDKFAKICTQQKGGQSRQGHALTTHQGNAPSAFLDGLPAMRAREDAMVVDGILRQCSGSGPAAFFGFLPWFEPDKRRSVLRRPHRSAPCRG